MTAVNEERKVFRRSGLAAIALALVVGLGFIIFYRRTQEQNTRVYAAITRLQATGLQTQQQLMERFLKAREDVERGLSKTGDPQKVQLQQKSEELRSQIASEQKTLPHCRNNSSQWKAASRRLRPKASLLRESSRPMSPVSALSMSCWLFVSTIAD